MSETEVAKITASLELDDSDFKDQMEGDQSLAEDLTSTLDDLSDKSLDIDASGVTDALQEATDSASNFKDATGEIQDTTLDGDSSGYVDACNEADDATSSLEDDVASLKDMMATAFDVIEVGAAIAAIGMVGDAVDDLIGKYGELQYAATAASLKAGPGQSATVTPEIQALADQLAVQMGRPSSDIANVMGTLLGYGVSASSMTEQSLMPFMNLGELPGVGAGNAADLIELSSKNFKGVTQQSASDMIARTLESSNIGAGNLAGALSKGSLAANTGGIDLPTLLSMYTQENTQRGFDPSQVNMALTSATNKLSEPLESTTKLNSKTGELTTTYQGLAKTLDDEGISFDTVTNKSDSFMQKLVNLDQAGADFGKIFGARQGQILKDLADNSQGVENFSNVLKTSQGDAAGFASTMEATWPEAMNRVDSAVGSIEEHIGSLLAGPATDLANWLSGPGYQAINTFISALASGDTTKIGAAIDNIISQLQVLWGQLEHTEGFVALENAGIMAFNAIVHACVDAANAIGSTLYGAIDDVMGAFANLADTANSALESATGGLLSLNSLMSTSTSSSSGGNNASDTGVSAAQQYAQTGTARTSSGAIIPVNAAGIQHLYIATASAQVPGTYNISDQSGNIVQTGFTTLSAAQSAASVRSSGGVQSSVATLPSGGALSDADMANLGSKYAQTGAGSASAADTGAAAPWWQGIAAAVSSPADWSGPAGSPQDPSMGSFVNSTKQGLQDIAWTYATAVEGQNAIITASNHESKVAIDAIPETQRTSMQKSVDTAIANTDQIDNTLNSGFHSITDLSKTGTTPVTFSSSTTPGADTSIGDKIRASEPKWTNIPYPTDIPLRQVDDETKDWSGSLTDLLGLTQNLTMNTYPFNDGLLTMLGEMNNLSGAAANTNANLKSTTVGFDALGDTLSGGTMSAFGNWQESNAASLFQGAYLGPSSGYQDWLNQQPESALGRPNLVNVGENYNETNQLVPIQLDDIQATTSLTTFQNKVTTPQKTPLQLDDYAAQSSLAADQDQASQSQTMPIKADGSEAEAVIEEIRANAAAGADMPIRASASGGGSSGGMSSSDWSGLENVLGVSGGGGMSSSDWSGLENVLGVGFAEGGIVPGPIGQPTLAIVHGGENVQTPAMQNASATPMTVYYSPNINGSGLSAQELSAILEADHATFMQEIEQKVANAGWR